MVPVPMRFPLFKLPYLAWRNVLATMDQLDLIQFSLRSKNMKRAVRSLFRKPNECCIEIEKTHLNIFVSGAVSVEVGFLLRDLLNPEPCTCTHNHKDQTITLLAIQDFRHKNWFDHIFGIFHVKRISSLSFKYISNFELLEFRAYPKILRDLTQGIEISQLDTSRGVQRQHLASLLESFPNIRNLCLDLKPVSSLTQLVKRNFDSIHFHHYMIATATDILYLKAKFINASIADYLFNQLLKGWVEGWNPLLTGMKLKLVHVNRVGFDEIFDGIDHQGPLITEKGTQFTIKNGGGISAAIIFHKEKNTDVVNPNHFKETDVDMLVADHQS